MKIKNSLYFLFLVLQINEMTVIDMKINDSNASFGIDLVSVTDPVSHVATQPDGRTSCGVSDYAIHNLFFSGPQVVGPIRFHDRGVRPYRCTVCGVPPLVFFHHSRRTDISSNHSFHSRFKDPSSTPSVKTGRGGGDRVAVRSPDGCVAYYIKMLKKN